MFGEVQAPICFSMAWAAAAIPAAFAALPGVSISVREGDRTRSGFQRVTTRNRQLSSARSWASDFSTMHRPGPLPLLGVSRSQSLAHRPRLAQVVALHLHELKPLHPLDLPDQHDVVLGLAPDLQQLAAEEHVEALARRDVVLIVEPVPSDTTALLQRVEVTVGELGHRGRGLPERG